MQSVKAARTLDATNVHDVKSTDEVLVNEEQCNCGSYKSYMAVDNFSLKSENNLMQEQYDKNLLGDCQNDCSATNSRSAFISSHVAVDDFGPSSCGAVAAWTVLCLLGFDNIDKHRLPLAIGIRKRAEIASLTSYLISRANAGCTASDLLGAICNVTHQAIGGRFFSTFPSRCFPLHRWLGFWIRRGAVPVLTLNLQKRLSEDSSLLADAWHHDVVFSVSHGRAAGPLIHTISCPTGFKESLISAQLDSDSVLLIRRSDVVSRFQQISTPLYGASNIDDVNDLRNLCNVSPAWNAANVLGQVVNIMREETFRHLGSLAVGDPYITSHLAIPAAYRAGITVFSCRNSPIMDLIMTAPELPVTN